MFYSLILYKMENIKHVNVEVTKDCNLSCVYCFNDSGKKAKELSLDNWHNAIDILQSYGAKSILLTGGEPMTRKDTPEIVKYAINQGLSPSILSNGLVLNKDNENMIKSLNKVQISLDSAKPYLHDMMRGPGSWDDAMKAIEYVRSLNIPVEISTVIRHDNFDELTGITKIAYDTGSKVLVRPIQSLGRAGNFNSYGLNTIISKKKEKLKYKFGDVFAKDSFGYVPVLGEAHDKIMIDQGIMTILSDGRIRGTNQNVLELSKKSA